MSIGWKFLADERAGFLNVLFLRPLLGFFGHDSESGPLNINSWPGVIFIYTVELIPFAYLMISVALRDIDSSYEEASRISGASAGRTLRKVSLPLIKPALMGATLLSFMIGAAIYSIPVILDTGGDLDDVGLHHQLDPVDLPTSARRDGGRRAVPRLLRRDAVVFRQALRGRRGSPASAASPAPGRWSTSARGAGRPRRS